MSAACLMRRSCSAPVYPRTYSKLTLLVCVATNCYPPCTKMHTKLPPRVRTVQDSLRQTSVTLTRQCCAQRPYHDPSQMNDFAPGGLRSRSSATAANRLRRAASESQGGKRRHISHPPNR